LDITPPESFFSRLNIKAAFDYKTDDARRSRKLPMAKPMHISAAPARSFRWRENLKNENRMLHLVPVPYDARLQDMYLPTTLSSEDLSESPVARRDYRHAGNERAAGELSIGRRIRSVYQ